MGLFGGQMRRHMFLAALAVMTVVGCAQSPSRFPLPYEPAAGPNISDLTVKANGGDVEAMVRLGQAYLDGYGSGDLAVAERWLVAAADRNASEAFTALAALHFRDPSRDDKGGNGSLRWIRLALRPFCREVSSNPAEGMRWLLKGADTGDADIMVTIGDNYRQSSCFRNPQEGVRWYRLGAEIGSLQAMLNLADAYFTGEGVEKDFAQGRRWRELAFAGSIGFGGGNGFAFLTPKNGGPVAGTTCSVLWLDLTAPLERCDGRPIETLKALAAAGDGKAMRELEIQYRNGNPYRAIERSEAEAARWRAAADAVNGRSGVAEFGRR